jgi:hypothetical protein
MIQPERFRFGLVRIWQDRHALLSVYLSARTRLTYTPVSHSSGTYRYAFKQA